MPEHLDALRACGADARPVRRPAELAEVAGLVLPGGESTTLSKLLVAFDLLEPLRERLAGGMPAFGSCAGMILLAREAIDARPDQHQLGALDISVRRNAFGRQVQSFEADLAVTGVVGGPVRAVFIRAPWVETVGRGVEVLARVPGTVAGDAAERSSTPRPGTGVGQGRRRPPGRGDGDRVPPRADRRRPPPRPLPAPRPRVRRLIPTSVPPTPGVPVHIAELRRHPVKSMLGERPAELLLAAGGVDHDRGLALVDAVTGLVATAKHPRLWRHLLQFSATLRDGGVVITTPDGRTIAADDPDVHEILSTVLGRPVRLTADRADGAAVERPDPEDVLDRGVEAEVEAGTLEIAQGTTGTTFVDHSPVHLITTATVDHIATEVERYRPNVVLETGPGTAAFVENDWLGREVALGDPDDGGVLLRLTLPTPRCSVPTLEHGPLGRAPHAVRTPVRENRVDVPGFGVLPCAGAYAEVVRPGVVRVGDTVTVG